MPELPDGAPPAPVTPLWQVEKWEFHIWCGSCRRRVVLSVADILRRTGPFVPIYRAVAQLRCNGWTPSGQCGARPSQVMLAQVHRHGKAARVIREVNVTPVKQ